MLMALYDHVEWPELAIKFFVKIDSCVALYTVKSTSNSTVYNNIVDKTIKKPVAAVFFALLDRQQLLVT